MLFSTLFSGERISITPGVLSAEEASITLSALAMKLSAMIVMLPPGPPNALAMIVLLFTLTNSGSITMLPLVPEPPCTLVLMTLSWGRKRYGAAMAMLQASAVSVCVVLWPSCG